MKATGHNQPDIFLLHLLKLGNRNTFLKGKEVDILNSVCLILISAASDLTGRFTRQHTKLLLQGTFHHDKLAQRGIKIWLYFLP